jgi:hypothetical protein
VNGIQKGSRLFGEASKSTGLAVMERPRDGLGKNGAEPITIKKINNGAAAPPYGGVINGSLLKILID